MLLKPLKLVGRSSKLGNKFNQYGALRRKDDGSDDAEKGVELFVDVKEWHARWQAE